MVLIKDSLVLIRKSILVSGGGGFLLLLSEWSSAICLIPPNRTFAHGAMGRRIDPSWGEPIELFLVPPVLHDWWKTKAVVCVILSVGWCI